MCLEMHREEGFLSKIFWVPFLLISELTSALKHVQRMLCGEEKRQQNGEGSMNTRERESRIKGQVDPEEGKP